MIAAPDRVYGRSMRRQTRAASRAVAGVLLLALSACGNGDGDDASPTATPSPTPTATATAGAFGAFAGTYDLASSGDSATGLSGDGLATVVFAPAGELTISFLFDTGGSASASGTPRADRSVSLTGSGVVSGDILFRLTGSAALSTAFTPVEVQRITGSMQSESVFPRSSNQFTLERPASGTFTGLAGVCRLTLEPSPSGCGCPSTATMHLEVPADGMGRSPLAFDDVDAAGTPLGTFAPGDCLVSPQGRIHCGLAYTGIFPAPSEPLPRPPSLFTLLTGQLEPNFGVATGSGRITVPPPSFPFVATAWTAVCEQEDASSRSAPP